MRRREWFSTSTTSTTSTSTPALASATRQLNASAMGTRTAGASAQPRLPVMPCTLNAWPRRELWTLRLSKV